jgi:Xaa-Pro aminopeptidase
MQLTDPALEVKISDEEFAERRKRVEAAARAEGLDALIAFSTTSLQGASAYLTGYEPRFGPKEVTAVAVVPGGAAALVSYAYWDELGPMPWLDEVLVQPDLQKIATTIADRIPEGARRVGVAGYAHFPAPFAAAVARVRPKVLLEDATGMLLGLAVTKTEAEIGLLTAAARMTDAGIRAFLESVGDGVEETHISIAVEKAMIDAGAERFAFPLLIFGGARIASGIGFAAHRRVRAGDQVNIVCGAVHRTYKMDIGRVTTVGRPHADALSVMEGAAAMIEAMLELTRPGAPVRALSDAATGVVKGRDLADLIWPYAAPGYVGHGIGCWLDEPPRLIADAAGQLKEGMVLVLEARLGRVGRPGAAITDPVVVRATGAERLSEIPIRTWPR